MNQSDLELIKNIAEIDGHTFAPWSAKQGIPAVLREGSTKCGWAYNPLSSDKVLGPLLRKYITSYRRDVLIAPEGDTEVHYFTAFHGPEVMGTDYARTALEAIEESYK
tara:strand:+ start:66 stop:389 length:324 start_codon:yes stop_codon:yes gene_type:complete